MFVRNVLKFSRRPFTRGYALFGDGGCAVEINDAPVKTTALCNGIKVVTQETNSPLASVALFIEAGPRYETACSNGITHFIEHLAYKGMFSMNKCCIEECALYSGIRFRARTTQEYQYFQAICPVEATPKALEILCKIIAELNPTDHEIQAERYNFHLELCDADRNIKALTFENLLRTAFQGTSLGQPVIGPSGNLERFSAEYVKMYMCQHYQPWRLTFATSGYVNHDLMVGTVCTYLDAMEPSSCTADYGAKRYTGSSMVYRDDSQPFAHVCIAFEVGGYNSPEYTILQVMKHMIGSWSKSKVGGGGNWPQLAKRCADTELCDSYESFYLAFRDVGLWGTYFVSSGKEVEDMVENLTNVWMHMCTTTVFSDIDRARRAAILEGSRKRDGSIKACRTIARDIMYKGKYTSLSDYRSLVNSIKVNTLVDVAEPSLYDRCPVVAAVGPTEALPDYTRLRAGTYWLRL